jgi:hypothetical protein
MPRISICTCPSSIKCLPCASQEKWPAFAIQDVTKNQKFPFDQAKDITAADIETFVTSFLDGSLKPSVKSEPIPEKQEGPVTVVVGHTYKDIVLDDKKDVLIEFYAPWVKLQSTIPSDVSSSVDTARLSLPNMTNSPPYMPPTRTRSSLPNAMRPPTTSPTATSRASPPSNCTPPARRTPPSPTLVTAPSKI